ncbi:WD40-repeat-containing domain protein [Mycena rosella]|uniref:WD40-repeat-containing domain protein n=1 Tax=Mycena rosella TaxID=1033263 RepID=A0AAD7GDL5_MYCRO|nr:WD40-repeat-containing domain protein [Mycena rosella]
MDVSITGSTGTWKISKRSIRIIFDSHQQKIYSLEFSFDDRIIVSGSGDRTPLSAPSNPPTNADAGVTSIAISPDDAVAAGCIDAVVRIWSVATGALGELLHGHPDSVYSVVFTRDGYRIVSRSFDNTLKHWDLHGVTARKEGGKPTVGTTNLLGYKDYVLSVAVSYWVLSGSKDRGVQFWAADGIMQCMLKGHKHYGLRSFICARPPPRETDTRQLCPAPSRT